MRKLSFVDQDTPAVVLRNGCVFFLRRKKKTLTHRPLPDILLLSERALLQSGEEQTFWQAFECGYFQKRKALFSSGEVA